MANTLKFGNGEWYGKKDTILAYNDENNNYKPLPFDFSRASKATVINKDGLIEEVGSGQPRVDYKDNSKGALKLEPQRTNKVTYEDFTQWTDYNASAVLSEETIYGKKAYKIVEDNTTNYHGVYLSNLFGADGTNYIWSAYVKGAERRYVVLTARTGISSNSSALIFDTQEGEWVLDDSSQNEALFAENVGNGWWRIGIEGNPTSGAYDSYTIASAIGFSSYLDANYQGDGTSGFYVAMAQLEQGSYATSYIPTSGSAVTRIYDTMPSYLDVTPLNIGNSYTLFLDADLNVNDYNKVFGAINNSVGGLSFTVRNYLGGIRLYNHIDAGYPVNEIISSTNKFLIRVDGNSYKVFVQGSSLSGTLTTQRDLGSLNFYGQNTELKINNFTINDTALSDAECQALVN